MIKNLTFTLLLAVGLAVAQTRTYTMTFHGYCNSANGCGPENYPEVTPGEPAVAPQPEPMYYPWVYANYSTGLNVPYSFHTGSVHPQVPVPQVSTGSGAFQWSDGGAKSGTITVALSCRFDVYPAWPVYAVTCNGTDDAGNNVSLTHEVYLFGPLRFGYWNWADHYGTIVITITGGTDD